MLRSCVFRMCLTRFLREQLRWRADLGWRRAFSAALQAPPWNKGFDGRSVLRPVIPAVNRTRARSWRCSYYQTEGSDAKSESWGLEDLFERPQISRQTRMPKLMERKSPRRVETGAPQPTSVSNKSVNLDTPWRMESAEEPDVWQDCG